MNNLIVSRFGGNATADSAEMKRTADIIKADPARRYVVMSAPGSNSRSLGITDLLYLCHSRFHNHEKYDDALSDISGRYKEIVSGLGINFNIDAEISALKGSLELGMNLDYIGSRGEYIIARIMAEYLGWEFVDASKILFFNKDGTPDKARTISVAGEKLKSLKHAVIPSFYGSLPDGKVKTFTRGDCDTAGALVACSVNAEMFEKWSDDAKIFSADPKVIPNSEIIRHITYMEALEINYTGIEIVKDDVVFMLDEAKIPMKIASTHGSEDDAMTISPEMPEDNPSGVTACIAGQKNFSIVHIQKYGVNSSYGFGEKLFNIFTKHRISCRYCLSGIHRMSVVLKSPVFDIRRNDILREIKEAVGAEAVTVEKGLSIIAVVGKGIGTVKGVFGKIFMSLSWAGVKVQMIEQGSDKMNILIGVHDDDYEKAIKALYEALVLNKEEYY